VDFALFGRRFQALGASHRDGLVTSTAPRSTAAPGGRA
jgi:hypothetical protein